MLNVFKSGSCQVYSCSQFRSPNLWNFLRVSQPTTGRKLCQCEPGPTPCQKYTAGAKQPVHWFVQIKIQEGSCDSLELLYIKVMTVKLWGPLKLISRPYLGKIEIKLPLVTCFICVQILNRILVQYHVGFYMICFNRPCNIIHFMSCRNYIPFSNTYHWGAIKNSGPTSLWVHSNFPSPLGI